MSVAERPAAGDTSGRGAAFHSAPSEGETSVVEPYVAFRPALFVVEPDDVSRLLGTRVDPALRVGAKAGVGLNWKLGKDTTFFSAYELSTAGHGGLGSPGARSSADSALNGFDFTYGIRLRY